MDSTAESPPLALVAVLDRMAELLGMTRGQHRLELIFVDGRFVKGYPHPEPGKFTREQLDVSFPRPFCEP